MKTNQKGFTLVELIVVIAIVGILAAILIPSMIGYVKKSKLRAANFNAKNTYNALNNAATSLTSDGQISDIAKHAPVAVKSLDEDNELEKAALIALGDNGINTGYVCWDITPEQKISCAQWAEDKDSDTIVGQYPNPADNPDVAMVKLGSLLNSDKWSDDNRPSLT